MNNNDNNQIESIDSDMDEDISSTDEEIESHSPWCYNNLILNEEEFKRVCKLSPAQFNLILFPLLEIRGHPHGGHRYALCPLSVIILVLALLLLGELRGISLVQRGELPTNHCQLLS